MFRKFLTIILSLTLTMVLLTSCDVTVRPNVDIFKSICSSIDTEQEVGFTNDIATKSTEFAENNVHEEEGLESLGQESSPVDFADKGTNIVSLKFFRAQLNENEKELYDLLYNAVADCKETINIEKYNIGTDDFIKVYNFYTYDSPEHYWLKNISYGININSEKVYKVDFVYLVNQEEKQEMDQKLNTKTKEIFGSVDNEWSDYDKVKYVHDYIVQNTRYEISSPYNQSIISVFLYGESVCAGYTKAMQYLLNKLGIECILVTGVSQNQDHSWDIVCVDGDYYNIDVTWDDPIHNMDSDDFNRNNYVSYKYFLVTDEMLARTHTISPYAVDLPKCNSVTANYYVKEGLELDIFDSEAVDILVEKLISQIKDAKPVTFSFKFTTSEAYEEFMNSLYDNWFRVIKRVNLDIGNVIRVDDISYISGGTDNIVEILLNYRG